jgi:hypothetical protein
MANEMLAPYLNHWDAHGSGPFAMVNDFGMIVTYQMIR